MRTITKSQYIVKQFTQNTDDLVYTVTGGAHLTLVLLSLNRSALSATVKIRLLSSHSEATILGLVVGRKKCGISLQTIQEHKAKETKSNLLIRSILYDDANMTYKGGIIVDAVAQKTDAYQRNDTLLIGQRAQCVSVPFLEILANDVRCTHGATTSPIPQDVLWYMQTRGVSIQKSKRLYIEGFANSLMEKIGDTVIQKSVWKIIQSAI